MTIVAIVQAVLATMLLGIYFGADVKIGSTPFSLLRDTMGNAPIFSMPNYLDFVKDGNGLNPTLQNYWMVIHPPILFLGFSLTLVPFAYAVAAMWKGEYKTWVKPALRWTLIGGAVLGTGIMMGAAWAYESLTFGGYWAWDPVENASLVPWLTLVAGLHTLVIYKSTGRSLKTTLVFFILTFMLIWYSTFLTRTGILGDTSVHSFTGEGQALYWHLIIAMGIYLAVSLFFAIPAWKKIPRVAGEEELNTREFWMLIGSIMLLLSCLHIITLTSLPVWAPLWKKISGSDIAPPTNVVLYYNNIQVWAAILVAFLTGAIQLLKYKTTGMKAFWKAITLISIASLACAVALVWFQKIEAKQYMVFAFAIFFSLFGNLYYLFNTQKSKVFKAGGTVAHIGFGLVLMGILLSGYTQKIISIDTTNALQNKDFGKKTFEENVKESHENVLLFRNTSVTMGKYLVTYLGDSVVTDDPPKTYFKVRFDELNATTGKIDETFMLYPDAYVNPKGQEGINSNPDARHYWTHDVFIYISSISDPTQKSDTSAYRPNQMKIGDSLFLANGYLVFDSISKQVHNKNYERQKDDVSLEANFTAYGVGGKLGKLSPMYVIRGNEAGSVPDTLRDFGVTVKINKIIPEQNAIEFGVKQRAQQDDWIVMKAIVFPYIRILWLGIIIMVAGFFLSWWNRKK